MTAFSLVSILMLQVPDSYVVRHETPLADRVTLILAADRSSYYMGEAVSLHLSLKNVGDEPVRGCFMIDPAAGRAEVYYRKGASSFVRLKYLDLDRDIVESIRTLMRNDNLAAEVVVALDPNQKGFLLSEPGEYEFQVIYRDLPKNPNAVLTSNVVRAEVMAVPAGEREALASYSLELGMLAQFDPSRTYVGPEHIKAAVDFLDRFPNSSYSGHLRHGLAWALKDRVVRNRATKEERQLYEKLQVERAPNQ